MRIDMANPFEDENGVYVVLTNIEGQRSLWPASKKIPNGWQLDYGPDVRQACLLNIEANWTDMRPKSLVVAMDRAAEQRHSKPLAD
jgi:MbtH protein